MQFQWHTMSFIWQMAKWQKAKAGGLQGHNPFQAQFMQFFIFILFLFATGSGIDSDYRLLTDHLQDSLFYFFILLFVIVFIIVICYLLLFYFMLFYFMLVYLQRERVLSVTNMVVMFDCRSTGSPQGLLILFYFLFFILYFKKWQIITPYGINVWYGKIVYLYKENNRRDFQRREWILENKSTPQFFKV